jgi:hypothetical protein
MPDHRIAVLIKAGVASDPSDFSPEAKKVIEELTDEEFNALLSMREKISQLNGRTALEQFDRIVCIAF